MKIHEIISEAVDYDSLFNPIFQVVDDDNKAVLKTRVREEIKRAKAKLSNLKGSQNWLLYYLKYYRIHLAGLIYEKLDDTEENKPKFQRLQKVFDKNMLSNTVLSNRVLDDMLSTLQHFTAYDYDPIKKYNPSNKPWNVVKKELTQLEEKYFEQVGDDERFVELEEGDKILKEFNGGVVWMMLHRGSCSAEADAMGHCGNVPSEQRGDRIISLRKKRNVGKETYYEPFLTFIFNEETGKFGEMKGRANEKPASKYHPYIVWLITQDWVKGFGSGGYEPENNFSINDLSDDQQEKVIQENPNLALTPGRELDKIPEEVRDNIDLPTSPEKSRIWYSEENNRIYVKIDIDDLVDEYLLKFIQDPFSQFNDDYSYTDDAVANMLSELDEKNIKELYERYIKIIGEVDGIPDDDVISLEDFQRAVSRNRFFDIFEEYVDENDDEIDFEGESETYEEMMDNLRMISFQSSLNGYESGVLKAAYNELPEISIPNYNVELLHVGTMAERENEIYQFLTNDVEYAVYETSQYIEDDGDIFYEIQEELPGKIEIDDRYIDTTSSSDDINMLFADYF